MVFCGLARYNKDFEFANMVDMNLVLKAVPTETVGQYTGLKDKNGTMIFEGDLVRFIERGQIATGVVEFVNAYVGGWVVGDPEKTTDEKCSLAMRSNVEVIGNIHEKEREVE